MIGRRADAPRYGIINLTAAVEPYRSFDRIKLEYYRRNDVPYVQVYNEPRTRALEPHELLFVSDCAHPSGIPAMLQKFSWSLRELSQVGPWSDLDFIVRTNSSTILNLELFERSLRDLPRRRCYAGCMVMGRFVSGTCVILSKDLAALVASADTVRFSESYDDVAIARIVGRRLVRGRHVPMAFFDKDRDYSEEEVGAAMREYPLLRVKNNANRTRFDGSVWNSAAKILGLSERIAVDA